MKILTDTKRSELLAGLKNEGRNPIAEEFLNYLCFEPDEVSLGETVAYFKFLNEDKESVVIRCFYDVCSVCGDKFFYGIREMASYNIAKSFRAKELFEVFNILKIFYMGKANNCVLFTGAFCPPHIGHRNLITHSLNEGYDYAIVAVSNQKFLENKFRKSDEKSGIVYTEEQRVKMILAMTYDIPNVLIYGVEDGYTYEVLCNVKKKYGISNLSFACGSDKLNEINRWGYHDKLLSDFGFYILQRGDDSYEDITRKCNELFSRYKIVKKAEKYADISSTQIRNCMKSGEDYGELVSKKVAEIMKNL